MYQSHSRIGCTQSRIIIFEWQLLHIARSSHPTTTQTSTRRIDMMNEVKSFSVCHYGIIISFCSPAPTIWYRRFLPSRVHSAAGHRDFPFSPYIYYYHPACMGFGSVSLWHQQINCVCKNGFTCCCCIASNRRCSQNSENIRCVGKMSGNICCIFPNRPFFCCRSLNCPSGQFFPSIYAASACLPLFHSANCVHSVYAGDFTKNIRPKTRH